MLLQITHSAVLQHMGGREFDTEVACWHNEQHTITDWSCHIQVEISSKHKQYEQFVIIRLKLRNDTHILFLRVNTLSVANYRNNNCNLHCTSLRRHAESRAKLPWVARNAIPGRVTLITWGNKSTTIYRNS